MNKTQLFFRDKTVLITGASSGIGEELAWQLGQVGAKLTLVARRKERREGLAQKVGEIGHSVPLVVHCEVTQHGELRKSGAATGSHAGRWDAGIATARAGLVGGVR